MKREMQSRIVTAKVIAVSREEHTGKATRSWLVWRAGMVLAGILTFVLAATYPVGV